jgi:hypothetical protein
MYNLPLNKFFAGSCQRPKRVARLDEETGEVL